MEERLQKLLSSAGVCSRRTVEDYIKAGRISVNGVPAMLGERADPERDSITLDGKPVGTAAAPIYLILNKPRGYVTTLSDERGRKTVESLVSDCGGRVWPVGRLDLDSEGLILMTNDGDVTNKLLHPSHEVEKEYWVAVSGDLDLALPVLSGPLVLDGVALHPATVMCRGEGLLAITIHEGKNRQVRRMCTMAGLLVRGLQRVREGELRLGDLRPGRWRLLTQQEVEYLHSL